MPDFLIESEWHVCFATDLGTCGGKERNNWELFESLIYISLASFHLTERKVKSLCCTKCGKPWLL